MTESKKTSDKSGNAPDARKDDKPIGLGLLPKDNEKEGVGLGGIPPSGEERDTTTKGGLQRDVLPEEYGIRPPFSEGPKSVGIQPPSDESKMGGGLTEFASDEKRGLDPTGGAALSTGGLPESYGISPSLRIPDDGEIRGLDVSGLASKGGLAPDVRSAERSGIRGGLSGGGIQPFSDEISRPDKASGLGLQGPDENYVMAHRREKLDKLRAGGQAFPNTFRRDTLAEHLAGSYGGRDAASLEGETEVFKLAGRLMAKRVMGKASFAQLQDMSGRIQLFVQQAAVGEGLYADFKTWDVGDIVGAAGTVFKTRTGELSLKVSALELLVKTVRPLPEKWAGLTDTETRYRQRYVDLIMNPEVRRTFEVRARTVSFIRQFMDSLGFVEVETPMLQPIAGGATARPFVTHHNALDRDLYLRIAPELYLKRLVVGGVERVYEINRNFRNEGLSTRHNPEFTMLEFYQAYADYREAMDLVETMIRDCALAVLGGAELKYQGRDYDLAKPFARLSMAEAVARENPDLAPSSLRDRAALVAACDRLGIKHAPSMGPGKLLTELFEKTVEAKLVEPTFITEYPTEVSPLARRSDRDPDVTDRFEFFVGGREVANGFSELNDPDDQAARFKAQVAAKEAGDDEAMLYDADYIRALEYGLPPTAGVGVGIDRLVMFLTDSLSIRDVLLFPQMRPET